MYHKGKNYNEIKKVKWNNKIYCTNDSWKKRWYIFVRKNTKEHFVTGSVVSI